MRPVRSVAGSRLILALAVLVCLAQSIGSGQTARPRRIAGFGSSVAFGTGDEYGKEGYTGLLRTMLAPKGWEVLNQSRGGDTTASLATRWTPGEVADPSTRYLLPVHPGYVIIALSLANEGIFEASTREAKDRVFQQYADGIKGFIAKAREQHIVPVVTLCYPRSVYTSVEYEYIRRMNILQNSWDVPSVNFLGALDDGTGRWARGFMFNDKHPNASGHRDLALTFVPSLFDALESEKPAPARAPSDRGFARIASGPAPLTFVPESTMHPFALSVMVRTSHDGTVASISGSTLRATMEMKRSGSGPGVVEFEEAVLSPDRPFTSTIGVQGGKWIYKGASGSTIGGSSAADGRWHRIVLSHYTARNETLFYVDGQLAGRVAERLEPNRFDIGGGGPADYRDVFLFRSALNADEVDVLSKGGLLQASLEIYSPLVDQRFQIASVAENRAQSLAGLKILAGRISHVDENLP